MFLLNFFLATLVMIGAECQCGPSGRTYAQTQNIFRDFLNTIDQLRHGTTQDMRAALQECENLKGSIDTCDKEHQNRFYRSYGKVLSRLEQLDKALSVLQPFVESRTALPHTKLVYADMLTAHRDFTKAITIYNDIVDGEKTGSYLKIKARLGLGNARAGIQNYEDVSNILPRSNKEKLLRIQALIGLGNARADGKQVEHYNKAKNFLTMTPTNEQTYIYLRAQILIGLGNSHAGEENYQKALDLLGEDGSVSLRAKALIGLGNAYQNADYYVRALQLLGNNGCSILRAKAFIGLGNNHKGSNHYDNALDLLDPEKDKCIFNKAKIGLCNAISVENNALMGLVHFYQVYLLQLNDPNHHTKDQYQFFSKHLKNKECYVQAALNTRKPLSPEQTKAMEIFFPELLKAFLSQK